MTVYVLERLEDAGNWEKQFARELFRDVKPTLRKAGKASLRPLRMRTISQDAVHKSKFGRSWRFQTPNKKTLIIYKQARNPKNKFFYGSVIEAGRRPGARMPPPSHLEQWVQLKTPELVAQWGVKGAAFIVARSIGRKGIRPRPIMTASKMQRQMANRVVGELSTMWVRAAERARMAKAPKKGGA